MLLIWLKFAVLKSSVHYCTTVHVVCLQTGMNVCEAMVAVTVMLLVSIHLAAIDVSVMRDSREMVSSVQVSSARPN